jgi:hypothetical protein
VIIKQDNRRYIVLYSVFLELLISIYLTLMMTYILSKGTVYGLNGSGGAAGMLIGTAIILSFSC